MSRDTRVRCDGCGAVRFPQGTGEEAGRGDWFCIQVSVSREPLDREDRTAMVPIPREFDVCSRACAGKVAQTEAHRSGFYTWPGPPITFPGEAQP